MSIDINNLNQDSLAILDNAELINMVLVMSGELNKLKKSERVDMSDCEKRLEKLEREVNKDRQYSRRDSIEIAGISPDVKDEDIEEEVIKILKAAKAKAGNRYPTFFDIQAAHRKGRKSVVICKFVN